MPSTNLPGDSLKGTAGFRYFPGGSTSVAEAVHTLNWPAELMPMGGASYRTNKMRRSVDAADLSRRETFTLGEGREEATLRLRFDEWPDSLMDMLEDAADGVVLDYYPRLASTNLFFPVHVLDAEGRISEDSDRFAQAEYEADLMLRDASTDRQGFWWLKNDNKLKNPRLSRGATDGVAEDWTSVRLTTAVTFQVRSGERAQQIRVSNASSGSRGRIEQSVGGVLAGDVLALSAETRHQGTTHTAGRLQLQTRGSTGDLIDNTVTDFNTFAYTERTVSLTASSGAVTAKALLRLVAPTTTTGTTGRVRYRDARLTLQ